MCRADVHRKLVRKRSRCDQRDADSWRTMICVAGGMDAKSDLATPASRDQVHHWRPLRTHPDRRAARAPIPDYSPEGWEDERAGKRKKHRPVVGVDGTHRWTVLPCV